MKLSPALEIAVDAAMAGVRQKHDLAQQAPDMEAMRQALQSLRVAACKAEITIHNAEQETRAAAEDALIRERVLQLTT